MYCSSLIVSSVMAFFSTFRVCHARDLASEWINGDDGGGLPVGGHGKVASQTEDGVAHVSYKYLICTSINIHKSINTYLIG